MHIIFHLVGILLFLGLFLLGKKLIEKRERYAEALEKLPMSDGRRKSVLFYSGKVFEVVAVIGGFVESVAVLVLTSSSIMKLVVGE